MPMVNMEKHISWEPNVHYLPRTLNFFINSVLSLTIEDHLWEQIFKN